MPYATSVSRPCARAAQFATFTHASSSAAHEPPKIQRWIDLLAALLAPPLPATVRGADPRRPRLRRRRPVARDPPPDVRARQGRAPRLRHPDRDDRRRRARASARLPASAPRLLSAVPHRSAPTATTKAPRKIDKYGYGSLPTLTFEPEELAAIAEAAARVRELGDPLLAEHAESAMRKLACDLPMDAGDARRRHGCRARAAAGRRRRCSPALGEALAAAGSGSPSATTRWGATPTAERTVEPFGLFFLNQHWYLAARRAGREAGQELPAEPDHRRRGERAPARHPRLRDPRRLRPPASTPARARPGSWATATRSTAVVALRSAVRRRRRRRTGWARRSRATRTCRRFRVRRRGRLRPLAPLLRRRPRPGLARRRRGGIPRPGPRDPRHHHSA